MRVLIITYYYPPNPLIGSIRAAGLAKYLRQFGWQPVILTPAFPGRQPDGVEVIETGYRDVLADLKAKLGLDPQRSLHDQFGLSEGSKPSATPLHTRALNFAATCLSYPDRHKGWSSYAINALQQLKPRQRIDAIITSAPPVTCSLLGAKAKSLLDCPWVADFRDLWVDNLAAAMAPVIRRLQRPLERKTLAAADALVTVSEPWANRLRQSYPHKLIVKVPNGFDPADFGSEPPELTRYFSITYTGQLYQGKRDPTPLFEALQQLFRQGALSKNHVRVRFYGPTEAWLALAAEHHGLQDVVEIAGRISRAEVLHRQRESQLLLQLGWADPRETGQHTGKIFEYLGARRPILAVGGVRSVLTELLEETGAGVHALSPGELRQYLLNAYREFSSQGFVAYRGESAAVQRYTQVEMARKMADVLARVTGNPSPDPHSGIAEPATSLMSHLD